jgi:hypothetical protein
MKVACVFRLRDRRGEATEIRKGGFRIIIAETRGACVIAINWLNTINIQISSCAGVWRAELAMYLV